MRRRGAAWIGAMLLLLLVAAPVASADRILPPDSMKLEVLDAAGNPENRAGVHPDRLLTHLLASEAEAGKDLEIDFPPGMGGNPRSVPTCSRVVFDQLEEEPGCPPESRVGTMRTVRPSGEQEELPIFNLEPLPGEVASFGAVVNFLRFKFSGRLRGDDFGLSTRVDSLPEAIFEERIKETIFEFWGVPADHQAGVSAPRRAFLTMPTRCDGPLTIGVHQTTWQEPTSIGVGSASTGIPLVGCAALPFAPTVDLAFEKPVIDTPTGFELDLHFPESAGIESLSPSQARNADIEFPAGMAISPGAAAGLRSCTDAQLGRNSNRPATCPASAKVGTVEIGAPALSAPLIGQVYIGEEKPDARFRLFVVASSPQTGTEAKFIGTMRPDPDTGRITAVLSDLPELAFDHLLMRFDGGSKALFATPMTCGAATVNATVTPYSGTAPVKASDSVAIGTRPGRSCAEAAPFNPSLTASISARRGGRPTSFSTVIARRDGEQLTDRFAISFPPGLSANLGSVGRCGAAELTAGSCPEKSRIGSSFVEIGSGSETAQLSGEAYLTGPYRRDPFGVALIFDAALGPFNFGKFVVLSGMRMDPLTGQVSVKTDSLPQSFQGIPVRFQTIGLEIDRPGFMRAPTSCTPKTVASTIQSTEGAVVHPAGELRVSGCVGLPFRPKLSLALTDRSEMHRLGRPGLRISMRSKRNEANMRSTGLVLPRAIRFSVGGLRELCSRQAALKGACPKGAKVGSGFARTPLLGKPLRGAIYVVEPSGSGEPDLWADLKGNGVELNLRSTSANVRGHVETRFQNLPDMPLSSFTMRFASGDRGVLSLRRNLCASRRAPALGAAASFGGHNGASRQLRVPIGIPTTCRAD